MHMLQLITQENWILRCCFVEGSYCGLSLEAAQSSRKWPWSGGTLGEKLSHFETFESDVLETSPATFNISRPILVLQDSRSIGLQPIIHTEHGLACGPMHFKAGVLCCMMHVALTCSLWDLFLLAWYSCFEQDVEFYSKQDLLSCQQATVHNHFSFFLCISSLLSQRFSELISFPLFSLESPPLAIFGSTHHKLLQKILA